LTTHTAHPTQPMAARHRPLPARSALRQGDADPATRYCDYAFPGSSYLGRTDLRPAGVGSVGHPAGSPRGPHSTWGCGPRGLVARLTVRIGLEGWMGTLPLQPPIGSPSGPQVGRIPSHSCTSVQGSKIAVAEATGTGDPVSAREGAAAEDGTGTRAAVDSRAMTRRRKRSITTPFPEATADAARSSRGSASKNDWCEAAVEESGFLSRCQDRHRDFRALFCSSWRSYARAAWRA
jgi:hypothetical protein